MSLLQLPSAVILETKKIKSVDRTDFHKQWKYTAFKYTFPNLEPVCCSMSSSNCYFLTCIQVSQEADKEVWCSPFFKNFPQFVVIHTGGESACNVGDLGLTLGEDPLEKGKAIHSNILVGEFHGL